MTKTNTERSPYQQLETISNVLHRNQQYYEMLTLWKAYNGEKRRNQIAHNSFWSHFEDGPTVAGWRSASALVSINEVNLRRARIVLRWVTVSGFNSRCRTFIYLVTQANSAFHPSRVDKMRTSFGCKGKGRHGVFRQRMNVGCAGKTVRSHENACHLNTLQVCSRWGAIQIHVYLTFT